MKSKTALSSFGPRKNLKLAMKQNRNKEQQYLANCWFRAPGPRKVVVLIFAVSGYLAASSAYAGKTPSYVITRKDARSFVMNYCRDQCERNSAKPRLPYCATFERALDGDFAALKTVFQNELYHTNDDQWDFVPWYILNVIGDSRYAAFVLSRPPPERRFLIALQWPSVVESTAQAKFDAYFHRRFPRTYALWANNDR